MASQARLQALIDGADIRRCILRYAHGADRLDWQLVVDSYVPGAMDDHGTFNGPVEKLAEWLASRSKSRGRKQHFIANQLIEVDGNRAVCESYYLCYIEFVGDEEYGGTDGLVTVLMGGRYLDRLAKYKAEWRIAERTVLLDWSRMLGEPLPWSAPAASHFAPGRQDGADPAQIAFAEFRLTASRPSGEPL